MKNKTNKSQKGTKKKMVLAKDPKQAITAIIVFLLFICTTLYNVISYYQSQQVSAVPESAEATKMAEGQQKSLESLQNSQSTTPGEQPPASSQDPMAVPQDANDIYAQTLKIKGGQNPSPASAQKLPNGSVKGHSEDEVEIMSAANAKLKSGKRIMITVAGSGRSNPFLPAGENYTSSSPSSLPKFALLPPPETLATGSQAEAVMGTTISGILFDKYSPSAILNIAGTDYLVKRGDVINSYHVLSISKDQVIVQLGKNVYKAGVGELLSAGLMNYNTVANLNKKFGGNEISVHVKKKGY